MHIWPEQRKILWAFVAALALFTAVFVYQNNYEFIGYIGVVTAILFVLLASNKHVKYPPALLWMLFVWALLHLLGGAEFAPGRVIYAYVLFPVVPEPYDILKYDQVVHAYGFFVGALAMFHVLKPYLTRPLWEGTRIQRSTSFLILSVPWPPRFFCDIETEIRRLPD